MNQSHETDNEQDAIADASTPATASASDAEKPTPARASRRRRGGFGRLLFWLIVLLLLAAGGWYGWQEMQRLRSENASAVSARDDALARVDALALRIQRIEADSRELPTRIEQASNAALEPIQQQVRQLAARQQAADSERAALAERLRRSEEYTVALQDQLAELGSAGVEGREHLLLDQAEFLLLGGAERLRLSADRDAALSAFRLAERVLSGLDDDRYGELRDTLAGEIRRIQALPIDPRQRLGAEIDAIDGLLPDLPARTATASGDSDSRLMRLLSKLVTVRRVDASDDRAPLLDPLRRETAIAALELDLGLARGALSRGDERGFRAAIGRARLAVERLYDSEQPPVADLLVRLDKLASASLATPDISLGATLSALRLLRASQSESGPAGAIEPGHAVVGGGRDEEE